VTDKPKHLFVSLFEQLQEGTLVKGASCFLRSDGRDEKSFF
jgi:hypothetical protein